MLEQVEVRALAPERLALLIGAARADRFERTASAARGALDGRVVWNVNSTATGGGVAELLQTLLAYTRGVGIDARWAVIRGNARFFEITKRIHNHLYGAAGDGGPLGETERRDYEATLQVNADSLLALVRPDDIVLLHDPQTAALARPVRRAGALVVWRCHVGIDRQNDRSELAWSFLRSHLEDVDACVFSRAQFAPAWMPRDRLAVIPPSIDPFSAKNEPIEHGDVRQLLQHVGLLDGTAPAPSATFTRRDGSHGQVARPVDLLGTDPAPPADAPLVLQASRWDAMKDMRGVMVAFAEHLADLNDVHLVLAGPQTSGVADDPEADAVLRDCLEAWRGLDERARRRVHLVCVPMADGDEAAAIVNAMQRHATVVTQKSLAEGFGLTVAEAMWKSRPVVGSAVGGIADQVVAGETGRLVADAGDLESFAAAVRSLLDDPIEAERMGANGRRRTLEHFLGDRHLEQWADLLARFDG
jgi:trehalose synthase